MKKQILLFCCLFLLIMSCKVQQPIRENSIKIERKLPQQKGSVSVLKREFIIKGLNEVSHKIYIYLPPNYSTTKEKYSVIYMQDAQNLFDVKTAFAAEWEVDETLDSLYHKTGKGFIIVGVENGGEKRIEEYTPWKNEKYGGGKGEIYIDFLVNELKPYIDRNYKTKKSAKDTAIIGSSLGGLISFYGGLKYPNVFGKIGALSTSFWFSNKVNEFAEKNGNQKKTKLYLLIGDKEGASMVADTENMAERLLDIGFPKKNIKTKVAPNGKHTESFWKREFLEVITYLYNL
ncbi:alpha/beta hydrolase-fold protein [Polaribacter sp. PL03]|uniref:alpha/beta hydrolase n=1 Tax=Polaribacter sp. PL03 TaxID=3088353 RepID=UPI0029CE24EA|nr:alpha/beta hydrolase-fold protein [Polaribacter sp. PL03]MDX6745537.1 alpha/beta hydrolase-fold protein [Polaribacter sp. PL03]